MPRCERCYGCEPLGRIICPYCNFPNEDIRTVQEIIEDNEFIENFHNDKDEEE